ncbi:hypothetical protein [Burkholderia gladioli]|uniref:hypothetical protein n=1 Tax=Burkholderia gladioli TaxID=28095 RepID=UPI00163FC419|nr:hypothetical protein [Burkholderia gladioli]
METTEERLEALAGPGAAVLTIPQLAKALGMNGPGAAQSIRNRIARGTFPIPSRKNGWVRVFSIQVIADWIDGVEPDRKANAKPARAAVAHARTALPPAPPKRHGRPTNVERARRLETGWNR